MQINGANLATTFLPKPTDCQESFSTPVIIEAAARRDEKLLTPATVNDSKNSLAVTVNDVLQSRFVRLFASANTTPTDNQYRSQTAFSSPSRAVDQYLQVANLKPDSDTGRLFDETI